MSLDLEGPVQPDEKNPPITDVVRGGKDQGARQQEGGKGGQWKNPLQGETFTGKALRRENWPAGDEKEGRAGPHFDLGKTPSLKENP